MSRYEPGLLLWPPARPRMKIAESAKNRFRGDWWGLGGHGFARIARNGPWKCAKAAERIRALNRKRSFLNRPFGCRGAPLCRPSLRAVHCKHEAQHEQYPGIRGRPTGAPRSAGAERGTRIGPSRGLSFTRGPNPGPALRELPGRHPNHPNHLVSILFAFQTYFSFKATAGNVLAAGAQ